MTYKSNFINIGPFLLKFVITSAIYNVMILMKNKTVGKEQMLKTYDVAEILPLF
jgi:hypothetical protein